MSEKPIIFCTDMVRAILDGRKTQTRRVIKPQPYHFSDCRDQGKLFDMGQNDWACASCGGDAMHHAPYSDGKGGVNAKYLPGDVLWVREAWAESTDLFGEFPRPIYKADYSEEQLREAKEKLFRWRPSIHMPRKAARLFLRVTDVRAERLQDITLDDCAKEGIVPASEFLLKYMGLDVLTKYMYLWDGLNSRRDDGAYAWDKNPWVWVYTFERINQEGGNKHVL